MAAFNRSGMSYDKHAFLQDEIAERLVERLVWFNITPQLILNCSADSHYIDQGINAYYPTAQIKNYNLLAQFNNIPLPVADQSVDLIIANLTLHWWTDINVC